MDLQVYAGILLIVRLVSMGFLFSVLRKQFHLFKKPIPDNIKKFRMTLFILTLVVFIGNIIPAGIDILTVLSDLTSSTRVLRPISVLYSLDAAGTALISSILIWTLYRTAERQSQEK